MIVPAALHRPTATNSTEWYSYLACRPWSGGDPDKRVFELVNGVPVEKKMGAFETTLANRLNRVLGAFVHTYGLGETFVGMEIELPAVVSRRKPDVCFVSYQTWSREQAIPRDPWWPVAPDLTVESVSPYELTHATLAKVQEYFAAGVRAVWLILPNVEQVYCYSSPTQVRILTRADALTGDPVVPGFRLPLVDLFPPADPATP